MMNKLFLMTLLVFAVPVFGHIRLKTPVPRSSSDSLKTSPCGNVARTGNPTVFQPGQTITVVWDETIDHPGYYTIEFSPANDQNFVILKQITDTKNGPGLHQFTDTVKLPSTPCEACTLRLIQFMTENPANPELYFACADIRITSSAPPPGPGQGSLGTDGTKPIAKMAGGCGLLHRGSQGRPPPPPGGAALVLLPIIAVLILRRLGFSRA